MNSNKEGAQARSSNYTERHSTEVLEGEEDENRRVEVDEYRGRGYTTERK